MTMQETIIGIVRRGTEKSRANVPTEDPRKLHDKYMRMLMDPDFEGLSTASRQICIDRLKDTSEQMCIDLLRDDSHE